MTRTRSVLIAAVFVAGVSLVGYLAVGPNATRPSTPSADSTDYADAAHEVRLENNHHEPRAVSVTITQNGTVVFEDTVEVPPGEEAVAYGWQNRTLPEDRDEFEVTVATGRTTETVTFRVDDCHGNVLGYVSEDGTLGLTYSVC